MSDTKEGDALPKRVSQYYVEPPAFLMPDPPTGADVLDEMAQTFRERSAAYGSNWQMVGRLMQVLFPDGVPTELPHHHQFHLFELVLVKISRFAVSNLEHNDSIHDAGVYCAMIESVLKSGETR